MPNVIRPVLAVTLLLLTGVVLRHALTEGRGAPHRAPSPAAASGPESLTELGVGFRSKSAYKNALLLAIARLAGTPVFRTCVSVTVWGTDAPVSGMLPDLIKVEFTRPADCSDTGRRQRLVSLFYDRQGHLLHESPDPAAASESRRSQSAAEAQLGWVALRAVDVALPPGDGGYSFSIAAQTTAEGFWVDLYRWSGNNRIWFNHDLTIQTFGTIPGSGFMCGIPAVPECARERRRAGALRRRR